MTDLELKEDQPYYEYLEEINREAEKESASQRILDDEYIYHIMWPAYFLSNGHSEDLDYNTEDEWLQWWFSWCDS